MITLLTENNEPLRIGCCWNGCRFRGRVYRVQAPGYRAVLTGAPIATPSGIRNSYCELHADKARAAGFLVTTE